MRKSVRAYFPIKSIKNGIIETNDGRFCKILEIYPINFSLKSISEQENILYSYKNFLNTCKFDIQILVQSEKKELSGHILEIEKNMKIENNEKVINLLKEYIKMLNNEVLKSAITKRFFIVFSSDILNKKSTKAQAVLDLQEKTLKIKSSLMACGNGIKEFDKNNEELINLIYTYMNPSTSKLQKFKEINYEYKY